MPANASKRVELIKDVFSQENIIKQSYDHFKSITPVKSGNAKRHTSLVGKDTIYAEYSYAKRLDNGWSNQAPNGMVKPTIEYIKRYIQQRLGK